MGQFFAIHAPTYLLPAAWLEFIIALSYVQKVQSQLNIHKKYIFLKRFHSIDQPTKGLLIGLLYLLCTGVGIPSNLFITYFTTQTDPLISTTQPLNTYSYRRILHYPIQLMTYK